MYTLLLATSEYMTETYFPKSHFLRSCIASVTPRMDQLRKELSARFVSNEGTATTLAAAAALLLVTVNPKYHELKALICLSVYEYTLGDDRSI